MTSQDIKRRAALKLLSKGIVTLAEAAELAGTSRQLVRYWAQQAGIDPVVVRWAYLRRLWAAATSR